MSADPPPSRPPPAPLPPQFVLDPLTWYIYRYFSHLLTDEERAAMRVHHGRFKQWACEPAGNEHREFCVEAAHPELVRRIDEHGFARVMREAAERVLRDNPEKQILHTCAKCGALCRTPIARQCFECGFDWHSQGAE